MKFLIKLMFYFLNSNFIKINVLIFQKNKTLLKNIIVRKYSKQDINLWNSYVKSSKNGTFLHNRNFMDYHCDRFEDFSMIVSENEKLIAVLPANISNHILYSHQGLSYGGILFDEKIKLEKAILIFQTILKFLSENKIDIFHIKTIPSIYHKKPAEEINYALFLKNAKLVRCDSLSILDLSKNNKIASGRLEGIKKAKKFNLYIKEENNLDSFWNEILVPNLQTKFNTNPVHNLEEITKLKKHFPENIRQFNVYQNDKLVAGTTIFETETVAHAQYISGNESKSEIGSVDFLYHYLITDIFKNKQFFDFGTSNEQQGRKLNSGLNFWKESFGASTIVQNFYEVKTKNFDLLDNILI